MTHRDRYKRRGRRYKASFKRRVVRRALLVGLARASREEDCTPQSIYRWADEQGIRLVGGGSKDANPV